MIHKIKLDDKLKTVKVFTLGLLIGAVVMGLSLDNRMGALIKAFNHPTAINGMSVSVEVIKK